MRDIRRSTCNQGDFWTCVQKSVERSSPDNDHDEWKQIAFNHWLPKAGEGLSRFLGGKGWVSAYRPGDGSLVLLAAIVEAIGTISP